MSVTDEALRSISTPERVDSRLGALEYDTKTRSILQTPQRYPRAGGQILQPAPVVFDKTWRPTGIAPLS